MRPCLEALEPRDLPAPVLWHGGPVVAHPVLNNVFVGGDRPDVRALEATLVHEYLALLAPYGIGEGRVGASLVLPSLGPVVGGETLEGVLRVQVAAGVLPSPDGAQVYAIFLPAGVQVVRADGRVSGRDFGGYHSFIFLGGGLAPYLVVPELGYTPTALSHELAETVTDPLPGTGWFAGDPRTGEVADVYQPRTAPLNGYPAALLSGPAGEELVPGPASHALALWDLAVAQVAYRTLELRAGRGLTTAPACLDALDVMLGNPLAYTPEGLCALAQADLYALLVVRPAL
jgi:hypothetical protein